MDIDFKKKASLKGSVDVHSPAEFRTATVEANGVVANAGKTYDIAADVRKTAKDKWTEAIKNGDGDAAEAALKEMRDASEILGDVAAEAWAQTKFPNAKKLEDNLPGGAKSGQFDKIFVDESSGKLIIIEAKGGGSALGGKTVTVDRDGKALESEDVGYYQQGTKEYMDSVIANYKDKYQKASNGEIIMTNAELNSLKKTIEAFDALDDKELKIEYYEVRQKVNTDGSLGDVVVKEFEVEI